jgi:hypothetical protein
MIDGDPKMAGRGFKYVDDVTPKMEINRVNCPGDCPIGQPFFFFGGEYETARKTAAEWFKSQQGIGPVGPTEFVRKLVEVEIQASPEKVGPPITILRVDKQGAHWVLNDSACPTVVAATPR